MIRYYNNHTKFYRRPQLTRNFCVKNDNNLTLPFKIDRIKANSIFASDYHFLEEQPSNRKALVIQKKDPVTECFVPFHSASLFNIMSTFVGKYGIDRIEYYYTTEYNASTKSTRTVMRHRVVTDWYRVSGSTGMISYPFGTNWSQIYAGFVYPRVLVEQVLLINDKDTLMKFNKELIGQKIVYPHEMNIAFALEKINGRLRDVEEERIRRYIKNKYSADHAIVTTFDVNLDEATINLHSYHMPAYIFESNSSGLHNYKIINGFTGNIHSNRIYSFIRSAFLGAGVGGIITIGLSIASRPYLVPLEIATHVLFGTTITGVISGLFSNLLNHWNKDKYRLQLESDTQYNTEYIETDNDISRRKFAADINNQFEFVTKNNHRLPIDKLKLLQLESEQNITLVKLRQAYLVQIKKWHPDIHPNKKVADIMTKQINEAYSELKKILMKN